MTEANNIQQQADSNTLAQRASAWAALLPFPIWMGIGALIVLAFSAAANSHPDSGDALGWLMLLAAAIYFPIYLVLMAFAFFGILRGFTAWRQSRTLSLTILLWLDTCLLAGNAVYLAWWILGYFIQI